MKKIVLSSLLTAGCLFSTEITCFFLGMQPANAQMPILPNTRDDGLYYTFNGQQVPLTLRQDLIGVKFSRGGNARNPELGSAIRLQEDINSGTRSAALNLQVRPLGDRFAVVNIPAGTRSTSEDVALRIRGLSYVENTSPVLSRDDNDDLILLPDEIIVSFESEFANEQAQRAILERFDLEVLRPLPFTENRFVVQGRSTSGTEVLRVANRLSRIRGVKSATPNFVQSIPYNVPFQGLSENVLQNLPNPQEVLKQRLATLKSESISTEYQSELLPLQWHLDSRPRRGKLLPRIDVRAVEAWETGYSGEGVVVAVIDSLIQWDHPDLVGNLYQLPSIDDPLPGEQEAGYDFVQGDGDTRISSQEMDQIKPLWKDTFQLSYDEFLEKYPQLITNVKSKFPDLSETEIYIYAKNYVRNQISGEFHGTWSAGVIAANPLGNNGVFGVAPQAKFLPVRVFGLNGTILLEDLVSAIRYSAVRGADIINLSLGGALPSDEIAAAVFDVLDANPQLVIVASAGNQNIDGVSFPAGIPGVISVGSTNFQGYRSPYSSYGAQLDLVAPGGDISQFNSGGILTTGGTFAEDFWGGLTKPEYSWGYTIDPVGSYVQVQGTSFSGPVVTGVVALMKDANPSINRERIVAILKASSSSQALQLSEAEINRYRLQRQVGFDTSGRFRPSGIFPLPTPVPIEQYYFGSGLINAEAAVEEAE
jgi:subtilisin family serine protease